MYYATVTAFRPGPAHPGCILCFSVPSSTDFSPLSRFVPNVTVCIGAEFAERKLDVLRDCYGAEMRTHLHARSLEQCRALMRTAGARVGVPYAEEFQLVRSVAGLRDARDQHVGHDAGATPGCP